MYMSPQAPNGGFGPVDRVSLKLDHIHRAFKGAAFLE